MQLQHKINKIEAHLANKAQLLGKLTAHGTAPIKGRVHQQLSAISAELQQYKQYIDAKCYPQFINLRLHIIAKELLITF